MGCPRCSLWSTNRHVPPPNATPTLTWISRPSRSTPRLSTSRSVLFPLELLKTNTWTVGTEYNAAGAAQALVGALKYMIYPKDWQAVKSSAPTSVPVEQLEYRLDTSVIPTACTGVTDIDGNVNVLQYGLCMFIQIENPGVQRPLRVQYFYNPVTVATGSRAGTFVHHVVSGEADGFNTEAINSITDVSSPTDATNLVTVQDLQGNRAWNPADGDVSLAFLSENIWNMDVCSKRGLCDYDTGLCDCFSGYSGNRCDDQNAIAFSF